jgi:serine/threonine protein kinase
MVEETENEDTDYLQELFPELRLEGKVARGGFGVVYRAEHRRMRRPVALKFLDRMLARNPEAVALFQQEMISVGGLDHPGIVRAHDAGERDGHWYLIMELVDGMDGGALVRKHGTLPMAESCEIIRQAALALGHAHGMGLVHRDVKPGNVMVSKGTEGTEDVLFVPSVPLVPSSVKILDFGLAGLAVAPVFSHPAATGGSTLFLGTLEYISPEQIECPASVDARADIYSLGATLWRLLTEKTPHDRASPEMSLFLAMKRITSQPVPSLATVRPDLPKPLIQLCDAMLSLDREKRPASAEEVARLLEPWCVGADLPRLFTDGPLEEKPFIFPKKNRRPWWMAAFAAALCATSAGIFLEFRHLKTRQAAPAIPEPGAPLFSKARATELNLEEVLMPRLLSADWEVEREIIDISHKEGARFTPAGDIILFSYKFPEMPLRRISGSIETPALAGKLLQEIRCIGISPAGQIVWGMPEEPTGHQIGRALPDGTPLPALRYDFAAEFPPGTYELGRQFRLSQGKNVADAEPWDFAFVTAQNLPPDTGLRVGDVLVADHGHRVFLPGLNSTPGLWRFRLDSDAPASRLAKGPDDAWYCDVEITPQGVFALDALDFYPERIPADDPRRHNRHLQRWNRSGWHPCTTDPPLRAPCALAADTLSSDLYVLQGGRSITVGSANQSISRLRPAGPDRYTVEPFVTRLGKPSKNGLAFSPDGQRMIITDTGNHAIVVLKRKPLAGKVP